MGPFWYPSPKFMYVYVTLILTSLNLSTLKVKYNSSATLFYLHDVEKPRAKSYHFLLDVIDWILTWNVHWFACYLFLKPYWKKRPKINFFVNVAFSVENNLFLSYVIIMMMVIVPESPPAARAEMCKKQNFYY